MGNYQIELLNVLVNIFFYQRYIIQFHSCRSEREIEHGNKIRSKILQLHMVILDLESKSDFCRELFFK